MRKIIVLSTIFMVTTFIWISYGAQNSYASEQRTSEVTGAEEESTAIVYRLDVHKSLLAVLVQGDSDAMIEGHKRGIRAMDFTGIVKWHPEDYSQCDIKITVPVKMLTVDPPGLRTQLGLEGETSEKDRVKIEENMLSKSQLDAETFPEITFQSTLCTGTSGKVSVTGDLTIRGVTKSITTVMDVQSDSKTFRAKGNFSILHTDFGFKPFSAFLGMIRNDNTLTFFIDVVSDAVDSSRGL
jgi:polyisoprenoid-binding protein YceI